eukprot:m51a1_g4784 hypothetical protein (317) ;mRNA; f:58952-59983
MFKAVVVVAALAACAAALGNLRDEDHWEMFKAKFGKAYGDAESQRFAVFRSNVRAAERLARLDRGAAFGVTQFMDLTPAEFRATMTGLNKTRYTAWTSSLPRFVPTQPRGPLGSDWVAKGLVTKVKNQGQCGSCWAFSAAAAAEGCYAIKHQQTLDLSAQQIVDCCHEGSDGCNGGDEDACLEWAMAHDIATWDSYTYHTAQGKCKASGWETGLPKGTCTYYKVAEGEKAMSQALAHSTVAVAVDATPLQYYTGGVLSGSSCNYKDVDHAVLLVGDEGNAFTVKNSWGASWGEKGFFRLAKGVNCLQVASDASLAY